MSSFDFALPVILAHEGGWSDNPRDPGGATKYGISLRFLRAQGIDLDMDGDVDADDVRALSPQHAAALYRARFWDAEGYGRIVDQQVATKVCDMSVNMGPRRAHRLCQRALNECGERLEVDGVLGPDTVDAVNRTEARELLLELCAEQTAYYTTLAEVKPALAVFLVGWTRRARWPWGPDEYITSVPLPPAPVPEPKVIS